MGQYDNFWDNYKHQANPNIHHPLSFSQTSDVNVRVSSLTLFGALVSTQAPLPEIHLLLQQPGSTSSLSTPGISTPQELSQNWRQPVRKEEEASASPGAGVEGAAEGQCWLLQLCVALITQPREEPCSDSDAGGSGAAPLEPSPVRLEALQVRLLLGCQMYKCKTIGFVRLQIVCLSDFWCVGLFQVLAHLVKGYFSLVQTSLLELGQLSTRCLTEPDPSVQLHGTKVSNISHSLLFICTA